MVKNQKKFNRLSGFCLLEGINIDVIELIDKRAMLENCSRRSLLYEQEKPAQYLFLLLEGEVKLSHFLPDGKEIIHRFVQPGESFGESLLKGSKTRKESAMVLTNTASLVKIEKNELLHIVEHEPRWEPNLSRLMFRRLSETREKHEELIQYNAQARIHRFLLGLIDLKGTNIGLEVMVTFPYTHKDVAAYTQSSRQKVTSLLGQFRKEGHIYLNRGKLIVRDLERFKRLRF